MATQLPRRRVLLVSSAITAMAMLLAACQPIVPVSTGPGRAAVQQPAQAPVQAQGAVQVQGSEIKIVATDLKFDLGRIQIPAGKDMTVTLENKGVIEHDVAIDALKFKLTAAAGKTVQAKLPAAKAGEYEFYCSIPGHKEAGMKGTLVVGDVKAPPAAAVAPTAAAGAAQPIQATKPLPLPQVAPPVPVRAPTVVPVEIEAREIIASIDEGVSYEFWTFGGTVPGPMVRVRQGDTVVVTLKNAINSKLTHSIDLHATTGPGGGARVTQVAPGQSATFKFEAINPGIYVYHCATPMVAHHIANGMYGLIVVEPAGGLPKVDREFYVMQGDFYLQGDRGQKGHRVFSLEKMLDERADYILFNGSVGALTEANALRAKVGETVRIFFGVGGPNITSSFHVIGEIFDRVWPEGASEPMTNVQTTLVPTGGATMVDFKLQYPGSYVLVDHSLGRLNKGGAGILQVEGPADPKVFESTKPPSN